MDNKLLFYELVLNSKGLVPTNARNTLHESKSKKFWVPESPKLSIINHECLVKKKNVLQLPKSTVKIYSLFKNLKFQQSSKQSMETCNTTSNVTSKDVKPLNKYYKENQKSKSDTEIPKISIISDSDQVLHMNEKDENYKTNVFENVNTIPKKTDTSSNNKNWIKQHNVNEAGSSFEEDIEPNNKVIFNENIPEPFSVKEVPSSVQDWVNNLPYENSNSCNEGDTEQKITQNSVSVEPQDLANLASRLKREASVQSNSSLDSLLDSRMPDPIEIFLNLGFGGVPGVDFDNCRIPKRFLVPSKCKGGDWTEFLNREFLNAQNFECTSLGFRGLSGPSYKRPSAIVANIMEKLRERSVSQSYYRSRFTEVAKRVLNEKSVLTKITPEFQSVLSPDNRKFLQNQGKKSPEVPRRRIIFGQKSFAFANDGEFVEVESKKDSDNNKNLKSKVIISKNVIGKGDESNSKALLKLRRCSLQKQKKIDEDSDDVFFVVGNEEKSNEGDNYSVASSKCSEKSDKIPKRFLPSSNLKTLELDSDNSEAMRLEIEKEILNLSRKLSDINGKELASVLKQVSSAANIS